MAYTKNELSIENETNFSKNMKHERNINVDFMGNICKDMMISNKKWNTQTRVRIGLVFKKICWSNNVIF